MAAQVSLPMKPSRLLRLLRRTAGAKERETRRVIVVLGMDRAGTSLLANVLQALGGRLGDDLMAANEFNARGYFESNDIVALHDQILAVLGLSWSTPKFLVRLETDWWRQPALASLRNQLATNLERRLAGEAPFVFKDPRTARLLPLWKDIFSELAIEPVYVLSFRHPNAVAQSLFRRDGIDPLRVELLWLERYVDCWLHARGRIIAIVNYDDWFQAPEKTVRRLGKALRPVLPSSLADVDRVVHEIIGPELRHHTASGGDGILPLAMPFYAALLKGDAKQLATLADEAGTAFNMCQYAIQDIVRELDDKVRREAQRVSIRADKET
jgi:hypothetical protein